MTGERRPHSETRLRQRQVAVRFSPAEFAALAAACARSGRSMAAELRHALAVRENVPAGACGCGAPLSDGVTRTHAQGTGWGGGRP